MSVYSRGLFGPISDIQGFSMRDGLTHLEIQEKMRRAILDLIASQNTLVEHLRTAESDLQTAFASLAEDLQPARDEMLASLAAVAAYKLVIDGAIATLTDTASTLDTNVTALALRVTGAETAHTALAGRVTAAEADIAAWAAAPIVTESTDYAAMAI